MYDILQFPMQTKCKIQRTNFDRLNALSKSIGSLFFIVTQKFNSPHNLCFERTTCFGTNAKNGRFAQSFHMCFLCVDVLLLHNVCSYIVYNKKENVNTSNTENRKRRRSSSNGNGNGNGNDNGSQQQQQEMQRERGKKVARIYI